MDVKYMALRDIEVLVSQQEKTAVFGFRTKRRSTNCRNSKKKQMTTVQELENCFHSELFSFFSSIICSFLNFSFFIDFSIWIYI